MNIKRVIHYQLFDLGKAFLIYYFIILSIILLGGGVVIISSGNATFNGTGFSSTVFCFIAGLCMFREYFYLFSQNGVSRKTTYIGTLSSITLLSALISIIEVLFVYLSRLFPSDRIRFIHFMDIFTQVTASSSLALQILLDLILTFLIIITCFSAGYLIAVLFYRSSKILKIGIAAGLPVLLFLGLPLLAYIFPEAAARCGKLLMTISGLESGNPLIAMLTLVITAAFLNIVNYFAVRKAEL